MPATGARRKIGRNACATACSPGSATPAALSATRATMPEPALRRAYALPYHFLNGRVRAGVILPKLVMFALVDLLTVRRCDGPDGPSAAFAALPCAAAQKALAGRGGACGAAGGTCVVTHDGYYLLSYAAVGLGAGLYAWLARTLPRLEALPLDAWRAKSRTH